jgi:hypothetical protein
VPSINFPIHIRLKALNHSIFSHEKLDVEFQDDIKDKINKLVRELD